MGQNTKNPATTITRQNCLAESPTNAARLPTTKVGTVVIIRYGYVLGTAAYHLSLVGRLLQVFPLPITDDIFPTSHHHHCSAISSPPPAPIHLLRVLTARNRHRVCVRERQLGPESLPNKSSCDPTHRCPLRRTTALASPAPLVFFFFYWHITWATVLLSGCNLVDKGPLPVIDRLGQETDTVIEFLNQLGAVQAFFSSFPHLF